MPRRYCMSCTGCQSSNGSHTSWQFRRTKFGARPLWFTCTTELWQVPAAELYVHLPSRCWSNCSPGQTFPGVLSNFQHRPELVATNSSDQRLCLSLNPDLCFKARHSSGHRFNSVKAPKKYGKPTGKWIPVSTNVKVN